MARFQMVLVLLCGIVFSSPLYSQSLSARNYRQFLRNQSEATDRRVEWEKATKIGYYDNSLTYNDIINIGNSPFKIEVGNEYLLWTHPATIIKVVDDQSCIIFFNNFEGNYLLEGYSTQNFYNDMSICLMSYVKCTGVSSGPNRMRILRFIPKEESLKRVDKSLQKMEERRLEAEQRRLESSGFKKYELKNGETFYGHYKKTMGGFVIFEAFDGTTIKHKPKEFTEESINTYIEERKELQKSQKKKKGKKR